MVKGGAWRRLILHHTAVALPSILFSVLPIQSIIPYAAFFVINSKQTSIAYNGVVTGVLIASFTIGRAIGSPVWRWMARFCGRRAIVQIALLTEVVLTLSFGLSEKVSSMVGIRLASGFVYPGNAFSREMLVQEVATCSEDIPALTTISVLIHGLALSCGLFIGAFTRQTWELPYLEVCMVSGVILLVCFAAISLDFLDDRKEEVKPPNATVEKNVVKPGLHFERFKDENEGKSSEQSQRKDEVPSYLQQFAEPNNFPQLTVLKDIFSPMTTSARLNSTRESIDCAAECHSPPDELAKRTHISFTEEDLSFRHCPKPAEPHLSLPVSHSKLFFPGFLPSLCVYTGLLFLCTMSEFAGLYWIVAKAGEDISDSRVVGFILAGSAGLAALLGPVMMSRLCEVVDMNRVAVMGMVVGGCAAALIPGVVELDQRQWVVPGLVTAIVLRECGGKLAFAVLAMRLTDSLRPSLRMQALSVADLSGSLSKGLGIIAGPTSLIPAFLALPLSPIIFTIASASLWFTAAVVVAAGTPRHPRLSQVPFKC